MLGALIEFAANAPRRFVLRRMPREGVSAEIGVYKGSLSARILKVTQPRRLHLIDPWKFEGADTYRRSWYGGWKGGNQVQMDRVHESVVRRFERRIAAGQVVVHRSPSLDAAGQFGEAYFDWVYIDGNHLYDFVKADLEAFYPKVRPGGWMTGDDYGVRGWWDHGVTRAVDEFATEDRFDTIVIRNHQFLLRKRERLMGLTCRSERISAQPSLRDSTHPAGTRNSGP